MKLILLSGGSGTRLWPLSNDARSKQFLQLFNIEGTDEKESMIQRVVRQLKEFDIADDVIVATSSNQKDSVISQLGDNVTIVVEPTRRDTFPAICLACEYLAYEKKSAMDEPIIVMPCDVYTQKGYYDCIKRMANCISKDLYELMIMGITPAYPSTKFGYIIASNDTEGSYNVLKFTEKPDISTAETLIKNGAFWNGGVFAFKLKYLLEISRKYLNCNKFNDCLSFYDQYPKISFDYEVVENAKNIGMIQYSGLWKDLGTWDSLTEELPLHKYGNVFTDDSGINTHIINELDIPILCLGTKDLVIAASPDGIIVAEKNKSENIKRFTSQIRRRPMYEKRRWGEYQVINYTEFGDGFCSLTKLLTLIAGKSISYQRHKFRDEVWTFIDGEGEIVLDGLRMHVKRGDTIHIHKGQQHALKAYTQLSFIEVQSGSNLVEEDIERFDYNWNI